MTQDELPDFDDMIALASDIGRVTVELEKAKIEYDELRADITNVVTTNSQFWISGKVPSSTAIHDSYHITGYNVDTRQALSILRNKIAELEGTLEELKLKFKVYQTQIDVWRTLSANQRKTLL